MTLVQGQVVRKTTTATINALPASVVAIDAGNQLFADCIYLDNAATTPLDRRVLDKACGCRSGNPPTGVGSCNYSSNLLQSKLDNEAKG